MPTPGYLSPELQSSPEYLRVQQLRQELAVAEEAFQKKLGDPASVPATKSHPDFEYFFSQAQVPFAILTGRDFIFTYANAAYLQLLNGRQLLGKSLLEALPEMEGQPFPDLLKNVFDTGVPYHTFEIAATAVFDNTGKPFTKYFNLSYTPYKNEMGIVEGILASGYDITQQVELRNKIKDEQVNKQTYDFFMQAPAAFCILKGPNHVYELANPLYLEMIGHRNPVGKPIREALPELEGQIFFDLLDKVYKTGEAFIGREAQAFLKRKGDTADEIYLNFNYQPYYNTQGEIEGILAFVYEVTEQVTARKKLEAQAKMVENLFMKAPAFVCTLTGPEHVYDLINPMYQQLFGSRKLKGLKFKAALPELEGQGFYELLDNVYNTGEVYLGIEISAFIGRDYAELPEERYFNFSYQPMYDENQNIYGILTFGYEVTEQVLAKRKGEEDFKKLLESIPQMTWANLPDGLVNFYNQRWYDYTGLTHKETKDWGWEAVIHPDDLPNTRKVFSEALSSGNMFDMENRYKRGSDGMYRWHLNRALPIHNEKGEIQLWVGTATDIHDQKIFSEELERQVQERTKSLKEANIDLQHSNENLQQFASIASHDLQEPLRKIKTFAALLNQRFENNLPDAAKQLINKINTSSERMSVLIKDVLNFSKISHANERFEKTDLNRILENVLLDIDLMIAEKNATIKCDNLPVIDAIGLQMSQLFYNLLTNSIKFSNKDLPPVIVVSCSELTQADKENDNDLNPNIPYCRLMFSDNGIGFEQQFSEQIFNIFERLNSPEEFSGTGIGLALCKKIVLNHHGSIHATSIENEGACFNVILPLNQ